MYKKSRSRVLSLALEDRIRDLKRVILGLFISLTVCIGGLVMMPQFITLYAPPNARQGFTQQIGDIHPAVVYNTAFTFFQNLNYWAVDGATDMSKNLDKYQFLITANFREEMMKIYRKRIQGNDIAGKTRTLQELPGQGYSADRVEQINDYSWTVYLDTIVEESYKGRLYMRRAIRWPINVILGSTHEQFNPWGFRLDGFVSPPTEIALPQGLEL
ncbi:PFL_4703 family integrating conjugative element protein [uncultured Shewanella sp.]|uniref:PFL_4703 family integrating conjugative element protein n=1 Tax=uncultured Shewanella sp. TaxID=173975 RepID=UPI00261780AA|nr:TIGR03746 family integrating conjugative element protein [uncultured Shewanella sp.]